MSNENKKRRYIDLFAGCGGLSLGLHNAGWTGIFAIEKNNDAFNTLSTNLITYKKHFDWPSWLNMSSNDIYEILKTHKKDLEKISGSIDLIVGGPPCQGFSLAGKRMCNDDRNKLVDAYIEFVKLVKPKMVFLENVHGFTIGFGDSHKKGKPYSIIVKEKLEKLGYNIDSKIINMSDYGIPQKRKRFILVGTLDKKSNDFFKNLDLGKHKFLESKCIIEKITIEEAIGDLLKKNGTYRTKDMPNFDFGKYGQISSNYQKLMRINEFKIPDSHRFANHNEKTLEIFQKLIDRTDRLTRVTPSMKLVEGFKKRGVTVLKKDSICSTITSIPDDFLHFNEPRILTVREMARIQSFPDWYVFCGKYTTGGNLRKMDVPRYTQVANAVPPLFAEQVGIILKSMIE